MHFIIKLFPEITIKSKPVRKRMSQQLSNNLSGLLKSIDKGIKVIRNWETLDVYGPDEYADAARDVLAHTPGIANFAQVHTYPLVDVDDVFQKTKLHWGDRLQGQSFCVRVKRTGQHDFSSTEIEKYVGGGLNQHCDTGGVRLKKPDVTVRIEIRKDDLHVVETLQQGLGGYPLGCQDDVLSLISGGFDSTVSSYLTMKRGLKTHYCFFNLGGRAHEIGVKEVAYYLWHKYGASHSVKFVTIPFEGVVSEILKNVENPQMGVVLKRMMLRAATQVAESMGVQALVTGESVAQVSSQTLTNLSVIDQVTEMLTLRPLITMDKGDIIDICRKIGAEEFAANMPEYCGVISVKPTTRAKMPRIEAQEAKFDFSVLEQAVADQKVRPIYDVVKDLEEGLTAEIYTQVPPGSVVLDIRHPEEEELKPLKIDTPVQKLPFFQLNTEAEKLDKNTRYLLYCEKGVMSQLHASHLLDEGFKNFLVFRPEESVF